MCGGVEERSPREDLDNECSGSSFICNGPTWNTSVFISSGGTCGAGDTDLHALQWDELLTWEVLTGRETGRREGR